MDCRIAPLINISNITCPVTHNYALIRCNCYSFQLGLSGTTLSVLTGRFLDEQVELLRKLLLDETLENQLHVHSN